jgi:hypothetical protein
MAADNSRRNKRILVDQWAALVGSWKANGSTVAYVRPQPELQRPIGIAISGIHLDDGSVKAQVTLSAADTEGRILLGFRSVEERYVSIGLGGHGRAYVVQEFDPSFGWRGTAVAGIRSNLVSGRAYNLEVRLVGQRVFLSVDSVRVLAHQFEQPLASGQVGLLAVGGSKVTFKNVRVTKRRGAVFVVMQFSGRYNELYSKVIQPVAGEFELEARHVGEIWGPGLILHDITQGIIDAKIVIAEITPANQNVFYELGFSHALGKPTILLAKKGKKLPFDISGYRCLFYENSIRGKKAIEEGLRKHLAAILRE